MTTNRKALLIAIHEENILLQWLWIYENHVCDLRIKEWKWKGFKHYLGISENIAWKKIKACMGFEDRSKDAFMFSILFVTSHILRVL